jgi:hypothetical protein
VVGWTKTTALLRRGPERLERVVAEIAASDVRRHLDAAQHAVGHERPQLLRSRPRVLERDGPQRGHASAAGGDHAREPVVLDPAAPHALLGRRVVRQQQHERRQHHRVRAGRVLVGDDALQVGPLADRGAHLAAPHLERLPTALAPHARAP